MGFDECKDCIAKNVVLASNTVDNDRFAIHVEGKGHSYVVNWKLKVLVTDAKKKILPGNLVVIADAAGKEVFRGTTSIEGIVETVLPQYIVDAEGKKTSRLIAFNPAKPASVSILPVTWK